MSKNDRAAVIQGDRSVLVEVDHPGYERAREVLARCAEIKPAGVGSARADQALRPNQYPERVRLCAFCVRLSVFLGGHQIDVTVE